MPWVILVDQEARTPRKQNRDTSARRLHFLIVDVQRK